MSEENKMKKSVKKLWLTALRSGEYRQGHDVLRANGKFCCLGVLCDLYRKESGGPRWKNESGWSYLVIGVGMDKKDFLIELRDLLRKAYDD